MSDIVKLSTTKGNPMLYYVLRSVKNKEKVAYIPVEHHQVILRDLIEPDMAEEKLNQKDNMTEQEREEVEFVLQTNSKAGDS